jgi:putative heme-binding domain-containing protein
MKFLLSFLLLIIGIAQAQMANQPPMPQWIGVSAESEAGIETRFESQGRLLKAILLLACGTDTEVSLNGKAVKQVVATKDQPAVSLDLTARIVSGTNVLRLTAAKPHVAALLELNGDLAAVSWIPTDAKWTSPDGKVVVHGEVEAAKNPFDLKKTFDAYNSWQLAKPGAQSQATDPKDFTLLPGFKAELVCSAQPGEDSWVAMAFDPQGRVTLAKEKKGLLRLSDVGTPARNAQQAGVPAPLEEIESTLLECRGLVYAHGVLYANANNSKGLYRLRDADGDGVFEQKEELMHSEGGVGHGRNHIKLGPDGRIWVAHGNNVLLPSPIAEDSPLKNYANDQVLPNPWDGSMFDGTVELPAGHVVAYDPKTSRIELEAGGLRNPLDIAFNREGELFTFDADMERDVGTSWYMPTRVLHMVPGADFGWRRGTGRFPSWYVDTLPSVVDIGLSSPTGICFGYGAKFPKKYEDALFLLDWSYGRIIAVHMQAKGASYTGTQETFVSGRPLNVTDACVGPDGALWFVTGGRGTQSGVYRVTWIGPLSPAEDVVASKTHSGERAGVRGAPSADAPKMLPSPNLSPQQAVGETGARRGEGSESLRALRRELEMLWPKDTKEAFTAITHLEHEDLHIRHAARLALERAPTKLWKKEILEESPGWRGILGCLALARVGESSDRAGIFSRLDSLSFKDLSEEQKLATLRTLSVTLARLGDASTEEQTRLLAWLEPLYPAATREMNQELCRLLIRLGSKQVLAKTLPMLREATASEDLIFYPMHLRYLKEGWSLESKRIVFEALNRAEKHNGASTYFKSISDTRSELAAALSTEEMSKLAEVVHPPKPAALSPHAMPGHTFRVWKLEDLEPRLAEVGKGRSFEKGKAAAIASQCVFCHTMSTDRSLPAGLFGPELVQVSARFGRRDLLDHILNPSKIVDEKFRFVTINRGDGSTVMGSLESEDDERVVLKPNPLSPETVEVGKSLIKERSVSEASPMPAGLLNALKAEQILDLLAFIEAGGDAKKPNFQP